MKSHFSARLAFVWLSVLLFISCAACSRADKDSAESEEEALARTEFTDRIENYFEYEPLKAGETSQFLIHLTDLSDGTPVEKAEVVLTFKKTGNTAVVGQTTAKVGRVTGIYVADVNLPDAGDYDIEFRVKNAKLDERLPLTDFKAE